jgi:O-antigen/teichoic acid export membrane protein
MPIARYASAMMLVLSFVLNAGLNFILGLLVAYFLGPEEFGRYAIGAALMVLINASCLDWLKLAAIRFYSDGSRTSQPEIRATLDVLAAGIAMALSGLVLAAAISGLDLGLPVMLLAAAVMAGLCGGLFEYHGAIARARVLDRVYARLIMVKNLLALVFMVGGAWLTHDASLVLFGTALSLAAALLTVRHTLADAPLAFSRASWPHARDFASYALPLVGANVLYASVPFLNRSLLAGGYGFAEAGYFALAADMGIKLFGTLGAALELVLLQRVVAIDAADGRIAADRRMADNIIVVAMVFLPVALGLWLILPAFEALVVPPSYRGHFSGYFTALLPAFLAMGFFQAALNPVFMLAKKTLPAIMVAASAVVVNLMVLWAAAERQGAMAYAVAQSIGFVAALLATGLIVRPMLSARPSVRDLALIGLGLAVMTLLLLPLRGRFAPVLELPLMALIGAVAYAGVMVIGNVAGLRHQLQAWRMQRAAR